MKTFIQDFKAFAMRGNVIDLAFAVIIGAAFGKIVSSFVEDIIMPPIGWLIGGVKFSDLAITLQTGIGAPVLIKYGIFVQAVLDFIIVTLVLFIVLKVISRMQEKKAKEEAATPAKTAELLVLEQIRDSLRK